MKTDLDLERFGTHRGRGGRHIGFLLIPTYTMLAFVSAMEALRCANRVAGRNLYSWELFTPGGGDAVASNGIPVRAGGDLGADANCSIVLVCGPHEPYHYREKATLQWLRRQASRGVVLGAVDTGTYLLARAGLLDGVKCTIHWENKPGLAEEFPGLKVSDELFEVDRNTMTCAGGNGALDMMLWLIESDHGHQVAAQVSENFIHGEIRRADIPQRSNMRERTGIRHPKLLECLALMEANIEQPLEPAELATFVGISKRQLERLFQRYLSTTLSRHYLRLRLQSGRLLLEQTSLPILDVALACGFSSPGHFSQRYKYMYGVSPRDARTGAGPVAVRG